MDLGESATASLWTYTITSYSRSTTKLTGNATNDQTRCYLCFSNAKTGIKTHGNYSILFVTVQYFLGVSPERLSSRKLPTALKHSTWLSLFVHFHVLFVGGYFEFSINRSQWDNIIFRCGSRGISEGSPLPQRFGGGGGGGECWVFRERGGAKHLHPGWFFADMQITQITDPNIFLCKKSWFALLAKRLNNRAPSAGFSTKTKQNRMRGAMMQFTYHCIISNVFVQSAKILHFSFFPEPGSMKINPDVVTTCHSWLETCLCSVVYFSDGFRKLGVSQFFGLFFLGKVTCFDFLVTLIEIWSHR